MLANTPDCSVSRGGPAGDMSTEVQNWGERRKSEQQGLMTELAGDVQSKAILSTIRMNADGGKNLIQSGMKCILLKAERLDVSCMIAD